MSGKRRPDQAVLFDLELDAAPGADEPELRPEPARDPDALAAEAAAEPPAELAPVRSRLLAAGVDLFCHGAAAAAAGAGAAALGVPAESSALPGLTLFVAVFSLVFLVVPLAFWGKTAGMALAGVACRASEDQPLTFGEAARRWLGSLLTVVLAGLPALLVVAGGRSLADRLSGSDVVVG